MEWPARRDGPYYYSCPGVICTTIVPVSTYDQSESEHVTTISNHRNRLTEVEFRVTEGDSVIKRVSYTYDVYDRRIGKQVDSDGENGFDRSERFVFDANRDLLFTFLDADGDGPAAEPVLSNRFLNGAMVDQVLADELVNGGVSLDTYWPLADNLGSNRDVVRFNGTSTVPVEHLRFDAFGAILTDDNPNYTQRQTYAGLEFDADIGLYYAWHRWYDPATHRFISEDPSGFDAGDGNLNRYVGNDPANSTDPEGLQQYYHRPNINRGTGPWGSGGYGRGGRGPTGIQKGGSQGQGGSGPGPSSPLEPRYLDLPLMSIQELAAMVRANQQRRECRIEGSASLSTAVARARAAGVPEAEIQTILRRSYFSTPGRSPIIDDLANAASAITPQSTLMPGGTPVGRPGASTGIRRMNGGLVEAQRLFNELSTGGKNVTPPGYPGTLVELPCGGRVGLRPVSSSADRSPSIDINIPGIPVNKIHFEP